MYLSKSGFYKKYLSPFFFIRDDRIMELSRILEKRIPIQDLKLEFLDKESFAPFVKQWESFYFEQISLILFKNSSKSVPSISDNFICLVILPVFFFTSIPI